MRPKVFAVLGGLLVILGIVWMLQGLNALDQTGGMNGQPVWAVIGAVAAVIGLGLIATAVRESRAGRTPPAPR